MSLDKIRKLKAVQNDILKQDKPLEFISTGVGTLNILFSGRIDGGIPKGKVSMIAADSALGKSMLALKVAKNAQKKGMNVILFDSEKAYSTETASALGIDNDKILVIQKTSLEDVTTQFMNIIQEIEDEKDNYLFIIDSWNVLVTSKSVDDAVAGKDVSDMTISKKKNGFAKLLLNSGATVFVVNQIYACVSPDTLVKTENGTRPMSSIKTGDLVFTTEGLQEVVSKVEYKDVPVYEIELEDTSIKCSGIHRFINANTGEWIYTEEIKTGDILGNLQFDFSNKVKSIKLVGRETVQDIETKCHNYILGNDLISHNTMDAYSDDAIPGGKGIYFASSSIVQSTSKAKDKDSDGEISGAIVTAKTRKGRLAKEHSKLKYLIRYDGGLDPFYGLLDIALEGGFITKPTVGWYQKEGDEKKYREKEIYTKDFWSSIIQNEEFKSYVEKAFSFRQNEIKDEDLF